MFFPCRCRGPVGHIQMWTVVLVDLLFFPYRWRSAERPAILPICCVSLSFQLCPFSSPSGAAVAGGEGHRPLYGWQRGLRCSDSYHVVRNFDFVPTLSKNVCCVGRRGFRGWAGYRWSRGCATCRIDARGRADGQELVCRGRILGPPGPSTTLYSSPSSVCRLFSCPPR